MKAYILSLIIMISGCACKGAPGAIPVGTWDYDILINGVDAGEARTSVRADKNRYVSVSYMTIEAGEVVNSYTQTLTETVDFKPVSLKIENRVIHGSKTENIDTVAVFKDNTVTLTAGGSTRTITIDKPFVLDGAIYMSELVRRKFRKGTEISFSVYEPTVETEEPISVKLLVLGEKQVEINGESRTLVHVVESIAGIKNIDIYVDDEGITHKAVITMLNNSLELVLK